MKIACDKCGKWVESMEVQRPPDRRAYRYLGYEAAEGIDWVWEHRIDDLAEFGI